MLMKRRDSFNREFLRIFFEGGVLVLWPVFSIIILVLVFLSILFCYFEQPPSTSPSQDIVTSISDDSLFEFKEDIRNRQESNTIVSRPLYEPNIMQNGKPGSTLPKEPLDLANHLKSINDTLTIISTDVQSNNQQIRDKLDSITREIEDTAESLKRMQKEKRQYLLGNNFRERLYNAVLITFSAATIGARDYYPGTLGGNTVLLLASCLGLLTFGMIGGIAFAAARAAYIKTHPEEFKSE